ncbi:protein fuzzy homolog, partial [Camarhynchus parvulus]|uniref:protein fuzzy homolog n=1 Tax=Geospiza parvula TaxID=87175 RepID=UPI001237A735
MTSPPAWWAWPQPAASPCSAARPAHSCRSHWSGPCTGFSSSGRPGGELREAATPTAHLAWAGYGNSLTLVALSPSPGPAGPALTRILQSALGTLVLVLGQEELLPVRNVERLKRDLRGCFPLLDSLLKPRGGGGWGMGGPCWPLPPGTPREALQERLQRFAGAALTDLGCVLCGGGVAWIGTAHWEALPEDDSAHLRALLAPPPGVGVAARDVPVFLPNSSPKVCDIPDDQWDSSPSLPWIPGAPRVGGGSEADLELGHMAVQWWLACLEDEALPCSGPNHMVILSGRTGVRHVVVPKILQQLLVQLLLGQGQGAQGTNPQREGMLTSPSDPPGPPGAQKLGEKVIKNRQGLGGFGE